MTTYIISKVLSTDNTRDLQLQLNAHCPINVLRGIRINNVSTCMTAFMMVILFVDQKIYSPQGILIEMIWMSDHFEFLVEYRGGHDATWNHVIIGMTITLATFFAASCPGCDAQVCSTFWTIFSSSHRIQSLWEGCLEGTLKHDNTRASRT